MLTEEEIMSIRNRAKLREDRQIDIIPFARQIEQAVIDKLSKQHATDLNANERGEPDAIYLQLHDPDDIDAARAADYRGDGVTWCWERIHENDVRYVRDDLISKKITIFCVKKLAPDPWLDYIGTHGQQELSGGTSTKLE